MLDWYQYRKGIRQADIRIAGKLVMQMEVRRVGRLWRFRAVALDGSTICESGHDSGVRTAGAAQTFAESWLNHELRWVQKPDKFITFIHKQWEWSRNTFGSGKRTKGILDHMRKDMAEVLENPEDLSEWIDLTMLALDGYWRHGGTVSMLVRDLEAKQRKNFARRYPTPTSEDEAVEHDRSLD